VLPALLLKFHEAKCSSTPCVTLWGTGMPLREFLYADDMAEAVVFLMNRYSGERHVNVGSGKEVSIATLAEIIAGVVGYTGEIAFDPSKPDGTPRKLLDVSFLASLGWTSGTELRKGIARTYEWFAGQELLVEE